MVGTGVSPRPYTDRGIRERGAGLRLCGLVPLLLGSLPSGPFYPPEMGPGGIRPEVAPADATPVALLSSRHAAASGWSLGSGVAVTFLIWHT